jgi:hypothetical protein
MKKMNKANQFGGYIYNLRYKKEQWHFCQDAVAWDKVLMEIIVGVSVAEVATEDKHECFSLVKHGMCEVQIRTEE